MGGRRRVPPAAGLRSRARGAAPTQRVRRPHAAGRQFVSHHVHFRPRLGQRAERAVPQGQSPLSPRIAQVHPLGHAK